MKKWIAVLTAAAMGAAVLSGCGSSQKEEAGAETEAGTSGTEVSTSGTEAGAAGETEGTAESVSEESGSEEAGQEDSQDTSSSGSSDGLKDVTLKLKKTDVMLGVYYEFQLLLDCDLEQDEVEWSSEHPHIATVDEYGNVKAIKAGTTSITAKYGDQEVSCIVRCN